MIFALQKWTEESIFVVAMRVLFVCHGNICRSPMAEFILKALLKAYDLPVREWLKEHWLKR